MQPKETPKGPALRAVEYVEPLLKKRFPALAWLALAALVWLAACVAAAAAGFVGAPVFLLAAWLSWKGAKASERRFQELRAEGNAGVGLLLLFLVPVVLNIWVLLVSVMGTFASFTGMFSRGRQLREHGRALLPPVLPGEGWGGIPQAVAVAPVARPALAAQWRENGRTEHASVGAFARLTLDLLALGAPPALIADANRDALDEIRHTELCFSLARALDGQALAPGPFPAAATARTLPRTRVLALAQLAATSLVDGALNEGVSARVIGQLARRCEDPAIRAILAEIAADEWRHAAHGWDVVRWCLDEGGALVGTALRGAALAIPTTPRPSSPAAALDGSWERHGIHGAALERREYTRTRADLLRRLDALMAPDAPRAALAGVNRAL